MESGLDKCDSCIDCKVLLNGETKSISEPFPNWEAAKKQPGGYRADAGPNSDLCARIAQWNYQKLGREVNICRMIS